MRASSSSRLSLHARVRRSAALLAVVALCSPPGTAHAGPAVVDGGVVAAPFVGGIVIEHRAALGFARPHVGYHGVLADRAAWQCPSPPPPFVAGQPYRVTCTPNDSVITLRWNCDVAHVEAVGWTPDARLRTGFDCDGDGTPEAQTAVTTGVGHDRGFQLTSLYATRVTCTVDGGSIAAHPDYTATCGDPNLLGTGTSSAHVGRATLSPVGADSSVTATLTLYDDGRSVRVVGKGTGFRPTSQYTTALCTEEDYECWRMCLRRPMPRKCPLIAWHPVNDGGTERVLDSRVGLPGEQLDGYRSVVVLELTRDGVSPVLPGTDDVFVPRAYGGVSRMS